MDFNKEIFYKFALDTMCCYSLGLIIRSKMPYAESIKQKTEKKALYIISYQET